jgi:prevent-host-death family protein
MQVNILEAKNQLSKLVKAAASGTEVIIASNGKPVAKLVPIEQPRKLVKTARADIESAECFLSVASIWEVAIKHRIGKLPVAPRAFRDAMADAGATIMSVTDEHAIREAELEVAHTDPFDRLLLAVAATEQIMLLTADVRLHALNAIGLIKAV